MQNTLSYHVSKCSAENRASKLRAVRRAGRSSGNQRLDYIVTRSVRLFWRWRVVERSV